MPMLMYNTWVLTVELFNVYLNLLFAELNQRIYRACITENPCFIHREMGIVQTDSMLKKHKNRNIRLFPAIGFLVYLIPFNSCYSNIKY